MLRGIIWIVLMSPFSWQGRNLCGLSLVFVKDWRVVHCFQKFDFAHNSHIGASDFCKEIRFCCGGAEFIFSVERSRLVAPRISLFCSSGHEKISSALICNATCLTKDWSTPSQTHDCFHTSTETNEPCSGFKLSVDFNKKGNFYGNWFEDNFHQQDGKLFSLGSYKQRIECQVGMRWWHPICNVMPHF